MDMFDCFDEHSFSWNVTYPESCGSLQKSLLHYSDKCVSLLLGSDIRSEVCQRFFREGLTISFTKILTDEAVSGWKYEIHVSYFTNIAGVDFACEENDIGPCVCVCDV